MKVYNYDKYTKEYISSEVAFKDIVASKREGKDIFLIPAFSTTVEPPSLSEDENKVLVWNGEQWVKKDDYRGRVIYNVETGEQKVVESIGPLPLGYSLNNKPTLNQLKAQYLGLLKVNIDKYLSNNIIEIPKVKLSFCYNSIKRLKNELDLNITVSRDDNNQIYSNLTEEQYNYIIKYLGIYGQCIYMYKWEIENLIKKCNNVELIESLKGRTNIKIDLKHINNLMKMPDEKRKKYFLQNLSNIN